MQITVVEDETHVATLLCEFLESIGHSAQYAGDHQAAMSIQQVDAELAIIDYNCKFTSITGVDVLNHFQKLQPNIKSILLSGELDNISLSQQAMFDVAMCKPFNIQRLTSEIRRMAE